MQIKKLCGLFAGATIAIVPVAALMAANVKKPAGDPKKGAIDFHELGCSQCHGSAGNGGGWQGPKLAPNPLPFEAFLAQLREPVSKMPRYSSVVVSDQDVADMHAYLSTVAKDRPASEIRILQ